LTGAGEGRIIRQAGKGEAKAMRGWLAMGLAALLALCWPAVSLSAQHSAPPPYAYTETLTYSAPINEPRPADQIARETAAADAAEAACARADMAGCTVLGEAFMQGQGRPLNRPVAELVLRKACYGAEARGCYLLAVLLPGAVNRAPALSEADGFAIRGCRLGSSEACLAWAGTIEAGSIAERGPADAIAVRREACGRGLTAVCVDLGERLAGFETTPEARAEGRALLGRLCDGGNGDACRALGWSLSRYPTSEADTARAAALLDRQCRAGDARACDNAASIVRDSAGADDPRFTQYQGMGCYAGDTMACLFVAQTAARSGESAREAAIDFFERACPTFKHACTDAANLREQPAVAATCAAGDQRACVRLGTWMAERNGPFEDFPQAAALLGGACDAGEISGCLPAGRLLIETGGSDPAQAVRVDAYLTRACAGAEVKACTALAKALIEGQVLAQDTPRALALFAEACDAGDSDACKALSDRERQDPAAPLVLASGLVPPTVTPEELASQQAATFRAQTEALRRSKCTATRVIWEGREYADEACLNVDYSIGGFTVNRVELAPFQALLWRPAKLGSQTIGYRTACGGSVVATGWIITAAHCTYDLGVKIEDHDYRIRLGVIQPDAPEGNSYPILKVIRHPDFSPKTYQFDIALIQYDPQRGTRGAFAFGARRIAIDTRTVAQRKFRPLAPVFAFGWGRTSLDDPTPAKILQGVKLEVEDSARCTQRTAYRDWRKDSVLCAVGPNREQACKGDSGGPLVTYEDRPGVPTLVGVVSSGEKCSTTGVPSRYIRIGHDRVQEFLEDNLPGFKRAAPAPRAR
jgi:secreted trypsin-like serine protease/TPR repeat protein